MDTLMYSVSCKTEIVLKMSSYPKLELKLSKKSNQAFLDLAGDNFSQLCRCIRQDRKFLKRPKTIFIVLWNALSYLGNKMRPVYHTCRPIITQLYYLGLSYHLTLGVSYLERQQSIIRRETSVYHTQRDISLLYVGRHQSIKPIQSRPIITQLHQVYHNLLTLVLSDIIFSYLFRVGLS